MNELQRAFDICCVMFCMHCCALSPLLSFFGFRFVTLSIAACGVVLKIADDKWAKCRELYLVHQELIMYGNRA